MRIALSYILDRYEFDFVDEKYYREKPIYNV